MTLSAPVHGVTGSQANVLVEAAARKLVDAQGAAASQADISAYQAEHGVNWIDQPEAFALPSAVGASDLSGTGWGRTSTRAWAALSSLQLGRLDVCRVCRSKEGKLSDGEDG